MVSPSKVVASGEVTQPPCPLPVPRTTHTPRPGKTTGPKGGGDGGGGAGGGGVGGGSDGGGGVLQAEQPTHIPEIQSHFSTHDLDDVSQNGRHGGAGGGDGGMGGKGGAMKASNPALVRLAM